MPAAVIETVSVQSRERECPRIESRTVFLSVLHTFPGKEEL